MIYRVAADLLVMLHLAFVLFVVLGGLLALRRRAWAWAHLPAAGWGALIEFAGWPCPLTYLEVHFRNLGGEAGYPGGFVEHYVIPVLYPGTLTRAHQVGLGILVVGLNLTVYGWMAARMARKKGVAGPCAGPGTRGGEGPGNGGQGSAWG